MRILLLVCTYLLPAYAASVPRPSSTLIPNFSDLVSSNELSLLSNYSIVQAGFRESFCTVSDRWNQPARDENDCQGAVQYFYHETMSDGGRKTLLFQAPGAARGRHTKIEKTPRKYSFHPEPVTCTIAIIMIQDFPNAETLPGGFETGPPTDISTYYNLNRVAATLVEDCVVDMNGLAGWKLTGHHDGIGVFVWSTNSVLDKEIEDERTDSVSPTLELVGNGTAAMS